MKKCSKCKIDQDLTEFNKKGSGLQPWCRTCNRERSRLYYKDNPQKHKLAVKARNKKHRRLIGKYISFYKLAKGCRVCGYKLCAAALDAHHLDNDKLFNIGGEGRDKRIEDVRSELQKCEILCATHHRELHAGIKLPSIGQLDRPPDF